MVIQIEVASLPERLSFGALVDLAELTRPTVVGAWMTRIWLAASGSPGVGRRTADVDVQVDSAETVSSGELIALLEGRDYVRDDAGYPFRMTRRVAEGLRIIDLLVDASSASLDSPAFPVVGLGAATAELVSMKIESAMAKPIRVNVPTLERAFLLRCLAVEVGPEGLKFADYIDDALQLARLVRRSHVAGASLAELRSTPLGRRALDIIAPLFSDMAAPGSRAVSDRAVRDGDLAAREAAALFRALLDGGKVS